MFIPGPVLPRLSSAKAVLQCVSRGDKRRRELSMLANISHYKMSHHFLIERLNVPEVIRLRGPMAVYVTLKQGKGNRVDQSSAVFFDRGAPNATVQLDDLYRWE